MDHFDTLADVYPEVRDYMLDHADEVDVGEWHAMDVRGNSALVSHEWRNALWCAPMPASMSQLQAELRPNLPWAEDHFQERVSGKPLNPPPSEAWWPFAMAGNSVHKDGEKFSHTYPERYWPRNAGPYNQGIRFRYGDVNDLIALMLRNPETRQAFLPVWFPEDLAAAAQYKQRVPCTLGYHLLQRHGKLHMTYMIRSCDLRRHFVDDVYLSIRLAQWLLDRLSDHEVWRHAVMGDFTFHCMSLHFFEGDRRALTAESNEDPSTEAILNELDKDEVEGGAV